MVPLALPVPTWLPNVCLRKPEHANKKKKVVYNLACYRLPLFPFWTTQEERNHCEYFSRKRSGTGNGAGSDYWKSLPSFFPTFSLHTCVSLPHSPHRKPADTVSGGGVPRLPAPGETAGKHGLTVLTCPSCYGDGRVWGCGEPGPFTFGCSTPNHTIQTNIHQCFTFNAIFL